MRCAIRATAYLLILVAAIVAGGCAFGTRHPTLVYPPDEYPAGSPGYLPPGQIEASGRSVPGDLSLVLNAFSDQRVDKKGVGTVRNGYGMRTADVVPTNSVAEWVTEAVRSELKSSGYSVINGENDLDGDSATYVVSGEIENVFCDMYLDFSGQVSLVAAVRQSGKEILHKRYAGKGNTGIVIAATSESFAQSLALALASAVRQFVADLDGMFKTP